MLKGAFTSPKIRLLAVKLGVPFPHALGICGMLWNFTANHAPCGDVGRHDDASIAIAVEWPGDPKALVAALVGTRLVDEHPEHRLVIHDWAEHCPQYVRAKVARAGMSLVRTSVRTSANIESTLEEPLVQTAFTSASSCTHTSTLTHTHIKQSPNEEPEPASAVPVRRKRTQRWVWSEERNFADTDAEAVAEAQQTFTAIDVQHELREIHGYLMANPTKRPKSNWDRFMHLQLSRKHDRACNRKSWSQPDPTYDAPQHVRDCFNAIPAAFRTEPDVCLPLLDKAIGVLAERIGKPIEEAALVMGSKIAKYATSEVGRSKYGGKLRTWLERGRYNESAEAWKSRGGNQW